MNRAAASVIRIPSGAASAPEALAGTADPPLGVAVVGLGFMGRTHLAAWRRAAVDGYPVRVAAVHDRSGNRLDEAGTGNLDTGAEEAELAERAGPPPEFESDIEALLARDDVQVVSLCTPTHTHVDLAIEVLESGRDLLIEKPVAIRTADIRRLRDAADAAGRLVMPAMCMRFWPGWTELRKMVADRRHGAVRACSFVRGGSPPDWNPAFYDDHARSGGALFDLHVHDVDVIVACFGAPAAVTATGDRMHHTTIYHFEGPDAPAEVTAAGTWALPPSAGFRMRYLATFERAAAEFDLSAESPLVIHGADGSAAVEIASGAGYDGEIRHLAEVLLRRRAGEDVRPDATLADAEVVTRILEAEAISMDERRTIEIDAVG